MTIQDRIKQLRALAQADAPESAGFQVEAGICLASTSRLDHEAWIAYVAYYAPDKHSPQKWMRLTEQNTPDEALTAAVDYFVQKLREEVLRLKGRLAVMDAVLPTEGT